MTTFGETQSALSYINPVFAEYFADPFAFRYQGLYYAVGTSGTDDQDSVFQILRSENLIDWTPLGYAMPKLEGFAEGCYWAPEVSICEGCFYLYYSVGEGDKAHRVRVAVADNPAGPYRDLGPITASEISFAIDPHVYHHTDGQSYLYYATDFLDGDRPGTALVVDRLNEPTKLAGQPRIVARATSDWQRYQSDRPIYEGRYDWHTLEGPTVVHHEGRIYVFYSGGNWQNGSYGVDYVVADNPLGPYENTTGDHPRVLRTLPGTVIGPGHNSFVLGPDGRTRYAVYHAWNPERTARLMRIDPLIWTPEGPIIDGPSTTPQFLSGA